MAPGQEFAIPSLKLYEKGKSVSSSKVSGLNVNAPRGPQTPLSTSVPDMTSHESFCFLETTCNYSDEESDTGSNSHPEWWTRLFLIFCPTEGEMGGGSEERP